MTLLEPHSPAAQTALRSPLEENKDSAESGVDSRPSGALQSQPPPTWVSNLAQLGEDL